MADEKNRGGQKRGNQQPDSAQQKQGTTTGGVGQRSEGAKQADQMSNPDDQRRQPTNKQR
ncbi:MAG: hypothetical protein K2R98_29005 [Gemmataceae bacterium]|nr:hypothetical protein [Gemmataceae bacterium]